MFIFQCICYAHRTKFKSSRQQVQQSLADLLRFADRVYLNTDDNSYESKQFKVDVKEIVKTLQDGVQVTERTALAFVRPPKKEKSLISLL